MDAKKEKSRGYLGAHLSSNRTLMGYKRYSSYYSRRVVIIPSMFFFILLIQHILFVNFQQKHALKQHETIPILGQWKEIRRELGLSHMLPEEVIVIPAAVHSISPPQLHSSSRFFKRNNGVQSESHSAFPELFFSPDALKEERVSYEELNKYLSQIIMGEQDKRNHGRKNALKKAGIAR